jgi:RNA polymerase sigma-70 factor (ECF subfamily)
MNREMHERIARLSGPLVTADEDDALVREFGARLVESSTLAFRVAYSVLRHREDAEDVAQEVFARAHGRMRQLRDRDRFRAWLVRMTWRMALDRRRADRRRTLREQAVAADPVTGSGPDAERAAQLWQAIDELPEKLRLVVVLNAIEGRELREVSALLKVPEGTVKSRLFLARRRLKAWLTRVVDEPAAR